MNIYLVVKTDEHDNIEAIIAAYSTSDSALDHCRRMQPRMRYRVDVVTLDEPG